MIENHGPITTSYICEWMFRESERNFSFKDSSNVGISPPDRVLASSQMTINEAYRRFPQNKTGNNGTLSQ